MAGMDHLAPPLAEQHDMYEALTTNAWLLADTERLVQGQLVLCDAFRHPANLAREAVTLDHASGGRFELGIGWGSVVEEFTTYGVRPTAARERVGRLKETLEIVRALWTGEPLDYEGEWFQLVAARQMPTPLGQIPVVIGGTGPKTMALVAEHADWWNVPVHQLDRLDEMRDRAGDARVSIQRMYTFAPEGVRPRGDRGDRPEAVRVLEPWSSVEADEMLDHFHAMQEQGVERFYVWFTDFAPTATLEAFGAEVISSSGAAGGPRRASPRAARRSRG